MSRLYPYAIEGEWILPVQHGYRMACCDCALVILIDFRINKNKVEIRLNHSPRKSAALRRYDTKRFDRLFTGHVLAKNYQRIDSNEWMVVPKNNFILACIDCGLTHKINFRVIDNKVEFQVFHATRETAAIRRG